MLTFNRKKIKNLPFLKKKNYIGSDSPSERKYEALIGEYGDDPSFITSLGVKIFPTGDQFVIDAKTGRIILRDKSTRYLGRDEDSGLHIFIGEENELREGEQAHPSFAKEKELS